MFSLSLPKRDERGFTLIELLVVIIIIGILAAIAIPLFLDQRKLAVDASVKSDVRNTATQVQTWLATNPGLFATDAADYAGQGGKVVTSGANTVKLSVATDGGYTVCGYATGSGKAFTASSAAYVFDSATGRFGAGTCNGGVVGSGSPSSTPSATPTATPTTPATTVKATWTCDTDPADVKFWDVGYVSPNPSSVLSTSVVKSGASSCFITAKGSTSTPTKVGIQTGTPTQIEQNVSYTFSAWVQAPASSTVTGFRMNSGNAGASGPTITAVKGTWQQISFTYTRAIAGNLYPVIYVDGTGTMTFYVDDITVVQNN